MERDDRCDVLVGGSLIGSYDPRSRDLGPRNVLLVSLAQDPRMHYGQLASAFKLSEAQLLNLRKLAAEKGMQALFTKARGGSETKLTPRLKRKLERLFADGVNASDAHRRVADQHDIGLTTVWKFRKAWDAKQAGTKPASDEASAQPAGKDVGEQDAAPASSASTEAPVVAGSDCENEPIERLRPAEVRGGRMVQHVGAWLMIAMVARLGLHHRMAALAEKAIGNLRVIVDAIVAALSIGQRCVEGVRRLRTPTGSLLLRSNHVPTASWVRRVFRRLVDQGEDVGANLQKEMAKGYIEAARAEDVAVFYVDNHLRPYEGEHVIRLGWRMQDKRAVPGITDYYVHDEDGRPLFRVDVPSHDSLTKWLLPIGRQLRDELGAGERILLVFDRAGAYPEQMAELRDAGIEFVTYERRPFPLLAATAFDRTLDLDGEEIGLHESRLKNLGKSRGRVRRIALRMPGGQQVNLLASSKESAERLVSVMTGRWCQENAFKHGNERWGINQLDRRKVEHYDPSTIIPDPARRRLDRALKLARIREGLARRELARLAQDDPKRARFDNELADALTLQADIEILRPFIPTRAPLEETELAGKLVHHLGDYKLVIDAVRIACANAESELAGQLAPHIFRPAEAKKVIANILTAPGDIAVRTRSVEVTLYPAATPDELRGLRKLFLTVNRWRLTLPGDPRQRPVRFQLSPESAV
jgi:hypothetical protein